MAKLLIILLLIISVPVGVYLVSHQTNLFSRASTNGSIKAIDSLGQTFPENKTKSRFIYFGIEKPSWNQSFNLIQPALADNYYSAKLRHDLAENVTPGSQFKAYWEDVQNPTPKDWIGLFKASADNDHFENGQWLYTSSCNQTANV